MRAGNTDCNPSPAGRYYVGNKSVTESGIKCQAWSSQYPHRHIYNKKYLFSFPDGSASAAADYCRNPDGWEKGLWCFTTDRKKRWEACHVPDCGKSLHSSVML